MRACVLRTRMLPALPALGRWLGSQHQTMFQTLGLFRAVKCPDMATCLRPQCVFSHNPDTKAGSPLHIPLGIHKAPPVPIASTSQHPSAKRSASTMQSQTALVREPPTKLAKRGTAKKPVAVPTASTTSVRSFDLRTRRDLC